MSTTLVRIRVKGYSYLEKNNFCHISQLNWLRVKTMTKYDGYQLEFTVVFWI